jgi:hypothetical protein
MGLTTSCRARLGPPGGNRLVREPEGEASTLAQGVVVRRPIRHPVPLLRNAVTASGISFEWHGRNLWSEAEWASTLPSHSYQLAHPCNMATPYGSIVREEQFDPS